MTVQELIGMLEQCDPEAEVRIMMQESWPFECAIRGVCTREEIDSEEECECDHPINEPHEQGCPAAGEDDGEYGDGLAANDVFVVEGRQERDGSKKAWEIC